MTKSLLGQSLVKAIKMLIISVVKIIGIASAFVLKIIGNILLKISDVLERATTK